MSLTAKEASQRVIAWHPIGGSSADASTRHVGWGLPRSSWSTYVRLNIQPQLDAGVRRIMLHNPFGRTSLDQPMAFDQFVEAQESGHRWLTEGFVEAWLRVTSGDLTSGEKVEVICYLGSIDTDADLKQLYESDKLDAWHQRVRQSLAPAIDAGMSVAFDSSNDYAEDSLEFGVMRALDDRGIRIYVEPRPAADCPHLFKFPIISNQGHWLRSDPDRFQGAKHNARNADLTGGVMLLIRGVDETTARRQNLREILQTSDDCAAIVLTGELNARNTLLRWIARP